MTEIDRLLEANEAYASRHPDIADARPGRRLAIVTCMDARLDVARALGFEPGDAHVIRNAGGRVTDDVLRSLAVSVNVLGVDTVAIIQHSGCGMAGVTDEQLRERTGADFEFHTIDDHQRSLEADAAIVTSAPYLEKVTTVATAIFDTSSGRLVDVVTATRS